MQEFQIQNKSVSRLCEDAAAYMVIFNTWFYDPEKSADSAKGFFSEALDLENALRTAAKKHDGLNEFDSMVRFHAYELIRGVRNYIDYFHIKNRIKTIDQLIDSIYGKRFKRNFRESLKKFNYRTNRNRMMLEDHIPEYDDDAVPYITPVAKVVFEEFQAAFKQTLNMPKSVLDRYGARPVKIDVVYNGDDISGMDNDEGILTVDPNDGLFIHHHNGEYVINAASLLHIFFHEMTHYVRKPYSVNLPTICQSIDSNYSFASACHDEAIAMMMEKHAIEYIHKHPDLLFVVSNEGNIISRKKLDRNLLRAEELKIRTWENEYNFKKYFAWVIQRMRDNPDYNHMKEIEEFLSIRVKQSTTEKIDFHPRNWAADPEGFRKKMVEDEIMSEDYWSELPLLFGYRKGAMLLQRVKRSLSRTYGREFVKEEYPFLKDIFLTGNWSYRVFPRFVRYCIEHKEEYYEMLEDNTHVS